MSIGDADLDEPEAEKFRSIQRRRPFAKTTAKASGVLPAFIPAAMQRRTRRDEPTPSLAIETTPPAKAQMSFAIPTELVGQEAEHPTPVLPRLDESDDDVSEALRTALQDDDGDPGVWSEITQAEVDIDERPVPPGWPKAWPLIGREWSFPVRGEPSPTERLGAQVLAQRLVVYVTNGGLRNREDMVASALGRLARALTLGGKELPGHTSRDVTECLRRCLVAAGEQTEESDLRCNAVATVRFLVRRELPCTQLAAVGGLAALVATMAPVVNFDTAVTVANGLAALDTMARTVDDWRQDVDPLAQESSTAFSKVLAIAKAAMQRFRHDVDVQEAAMALLHTLTTTASDAETALMLKSDVAILADTVAGLRAHPEAAHVVSAGRATLANLALAGAPSVDDLVAMRRKLDADSVHHCSHNATHDDEGDTLDTKMRVDWTDDANHLAHTIMTMCDRHLQNGRLTITELQQGLAHSPYGAFADWLLRDRAHMFKVVDADKSGTLDILEIAAAVTAYQAHDEDTNGSVTAC